jgi:hypothetical protein
MKRRGGSACFYPDPLIYWQYPGYSYPRLSSDISVSRETLVHVAEIVFLGIAIECIATVISF